MPGVFILKSSCRKKPFLTILRVLLAVSFCGGWPGAMNISETTSNSPTLFAMSA